jgi:hypothetical protein
LSRIPYAPSARPQRGPAPGLVCTALQLTPDWLTAALRFAGIIDSNRITGVRSRAIGNGKLGTNLLLELEYAQSVAGVPASLVAKLPATDELARQAGVAYGLYWREVRFYQEIATTVGESVPRTLFADISDNRRDFCLLFEDLSPASGGDQLLGCTLNQAADVMDAAADLHGPRWGDITLNDRAWLPREALIPAYAKNYQTMVGPFCERYAETLPGDIMEAARRFGAHIQNYFALQRPPWTITHGDFRLDNMLFSARGGTLPVAVLDWQTATLGPGVTDVSYFLGAGLLTDPRRQHEESLLRRYRERLLAHGVRGYSWQACWQDYRLYAPQGLIQAVCAAMQTMRTERGDRLFTAMAERHGRQMLDLGTLDLLNSG